MLLLFQKIEQFNFAEKVEIKGFKNKLLSVDLSFRGDLDELEQKLKLNQMRIESYGVTDMEMPLFLLTEMNVNSVENDVEALQSNETEDILDRLEESQYEMNETKVQKSAENML